MVKIGISLEDFEEAPSNFSSNVKSMCTMRKANGCLLANAIVVDIVAVVHSYIQLSSHSSPMIRIDSAFIYNILVY